MSTPEGILKKQVKEYLDSMPKWWVILRLNTGVVRKGNRFIHLCDEGTSDYLACCPYPHWIELKAPGQTTTKARQIAQARFADRVRGLGHKYSIVTTVDELREAIGRGGEL